MAKYCEFDDCDEAAAGVASDGALLCDLHLALQDSVELSSRRHPSMRWQQLRMMMQEPPRARQEADGEPCSVTNLDERRKR